MINFNHIILYSRIKRDGLKLKKTYIMGYICEQLSPRQPLYPSSRFFVRMHIYWVRNILKFLDWNTDQ